jgi:hypothetical protein
MNSQKPEPIFTVPAPRLCPICKKPSYSAEGIHPQCAVVQADAPRQARLAAEKKALPKVKKKPRWEQTCPKCKTQVHVRRKVCECGYEFPIK